MILLFGFDPKQPLRPPEGLLLIDFFPKLCYNFNVVSTKI